MAKPLALLSPLALLLATTPLAAQSFDAKRIDSHIKTLSADSYGGRAPATEGETKTVAYLTEQFRAAGLQPGGDLVNGRRQWTQKVPLLKSDIVGAPQLTVTSAGKTIALRQGEEISVRSPLNGQQMIHLTNAPLVFAGYGVSAPERGWDDFKGQDVRGKILVVLINDPDFEGGEGEFGGKAMTYYGRWTYKYEEAARRGAAGVMVIHETAPASYGWATVKNSNTNTMFDIVRQNPAEAHAPFNSWIQLDTARAIFANAGLNFDTMKAAARRKDFQPVDLKASLDAHVMAKTETITSYNVAGVLRGRTRPGEYVIYTAHHDHIGIGQPDANGDAIFNGAVDNASGIAQLIEQARAFARAPRPQRSVLFLAVGAEEKGLLGSEYYAANPLYPLSRTVSVINTDSMGLHGPAKNFSISGLVKLDLLDLLIAEGQKKGRYFSPDPRPEAGGFFRSDHFPFAQVGVPAISYRSGNDLVEGGIERGNALAADYTSKRYHQPDDEWMPNFDYRGLVGDAQLLHALGMRLANSNLWPNWSQDSEFRAARDQSAGERGGSAPAPTQPAPVKSPGERG
ncbi:MAG TPA: M28 family metallopeptidase [Sphingomicrobium sp.]|nr:M28 family metallopeptidase [Sphingomicrobium sp.]